MTDIERAVDMLLLAQAARAKLAAGRTSITEGWRATPTGLCGGSPFRHRGSIRWRRRCETISPALRRKEG
jgi:hypothetical protein